LRVSVEFGFCSADCTESDSICGPNICQPVPDSLEGRKFCVERCGTSEDCAEGMECVGLGEDLKGCVPLDRD
jgi:hypothetical protein